MPLDPAEMSAYERDLWAVIKRHGHAVIGVFDPDGHDTSFAYTVGLSLRKEHGYELAIAGLSLDVMTEILNNLAGHLQSLHASTGAKPFEGLQLDGVLGDGYLIELHGADPGGPFGVARRLTGTRPPVWQAVWPDKQRRFPGESGYALGDLQAGLGRIIT